jgi:ankyrin repeat protein
MKMNRNFKHVLLAAAAAGTIGLMIAPPAAAHETDQYTLPHGRQFADLGPHLNAWAYDHIEEGVAKVNGRIEAALRSNNRKAVEAAQEPEEIVKAVNAALPNAYDVIENLNTLFHSPTMRSEYPGLVVGYHDQFGNIYEKAHFILDPRQFFRIWHAGTLYAYGSYLGADKIGHFTDMGRHYWNAYHSARKKGASEEEATRAAVKVGTDGAIFAESGMVGYLSAGAYSNGDLVANYLGFLFYRNLTDTVMLKGRRHPAMLVRDGEYWKIASHVQRDNDFFAVFICDHLNEVYNPSHFEKGMRDAIREALKKRQCVILERYADANGLRRSMAWFEKVTRECRTYYGADYGHVGAMDELITPASACFEPLPADASPSDRNDRGYTALHDAVVRGDSQRIAALASRGADVNAQIRSDEPFSSEWGATPLHLAARDGRPEIVETLIKAGAKVEAVDDRGATPMHWAAAHPGIAVALASHGANVNAADRAGRTPLHWAANLGKAESVQTLIGQGASVNVQDLAGETPLHLAARLGEARSVARLLENGADVNATAHFGITPLHLASARGDLETVNRLLDESANPNARDAFGLTPLHEAARHGRRQAVQAMLVNKADPAQADIAGISPLHLAARRGHEATVEAMLARGADANARSRAGATPLHEAAFSGRSSTIEALTDAGSDPAARDQQGRTPRDVAALRGHKDVLAMLIIGDDSSRVSAGAR